MDVEADRRMYQCSYSRPYSQVPSQIKANRIGFLAQHIERAQQQRSCRKK